MFKFQKQYNKIVITLIIKLKDFYRKNVISKNQNYEKIVIYMKGKRLISQLIKISLKSSAWYKGIIYIKKFTIREMPIVLKHVKTMLRFTHDKKKSNWNNTKYAYLSLQVIKFSLTTNLWEKRAFYSSLWVAFGNILSHIWSKQFFTSLKSDCILHIVTSFYWVRRWSYSNYHYLSTSY